MDKSNNLIILQYFLQIACFLLVSAEVSTQTVHQHPRDMIEDAQQNVTIICSHSNSNFYTIQWYKQSTRSRQITLIGYVRYESATVEKTFENDYEVSGDGRSLSLIHFQTVSGADGSVVYFCAASDAQCLINPVPSTKTL